ncbi:hypothetical protein MKY59_07560 [Paenibacillus sp. FSL W8-0426]|uniref:hypothetical protein n=1 Tax=Paenibacillus sp. FSL W8-0426 TaxID=2921714 RepID=UPI0030D81BFD
MGVIHLTIAAIIIEPKDQDHFYVPVSTEAFFQRCWVPGIIALELDLISRFADPGIDIDIHDLPKLTGEFHVLREWARRNLDENDSAQLINRINFLLEKIGEAFSDEKIIIYIG